MSRMIRHEDGTIEVLILTPGTFRGSPLEAAERAIQEAERCTALGEETGRRGDRAAASGNAERAERWYQAMGRFDRLGRTYITDACSILANLNR